MDDEFKRSLTPAEFERLLPYIMMERDIDILFRRGLVSQEQRDEFLRGLEKAKPDDLGR